MSKIETMRSSANSVAQQRGIQHVLDLHKTLEALNPAEIEQAMSQVQQTAAVYGDLMAKELITVSQALANLIGQAQDVTESLTSTLSKADQQIVKSTRAMSAASKELALIQNPPKVEKTHWETLLALVPLASLVVSLACLAVVVLKAV